MMKTEIAKKIEAITKSAIAAATAYAGKGLFPFQHAKVQYWGYKSMEDTIHVGTTWIPTSIKECKEFEIASDESHILAAALRADGARKNKDKEGPTKIVMPGSRSATADPIAPQVAAFVATLKAGGLADEAIAPLAEKFRATQVAAMVKEKADAKAKAEAKAKEKVLADAKATAVAVNTEPKE